MIQFKRRYIFFNYLSKQNIYVMKINAWFMYYLHVEVEGRMLQCCSGRVMRKIMIISGPTLPFLM